MGRTIAWVLLCHLALSAQVPTNFALLDSLAREASISLLKVYRCDSVTIVPAESVARWLIAEKLLSSGVVVRTTAPCSLAIADCAVRYQLHPSDAEHIVRTVRVELRLLTPETALSTAQSYTDTLARSDLVQVEMPRSELTSAPVPPPPRSLWDDILEPAIVVVSAAVTLLLLFTARTR